MIVSAGSLLSDVVFELENLGFENINKARIIRLLDQAQKEICNISKILYQIYVTNIIGNPVGYVLPDLFIIAHWVAYKDTTASVGRQLKPLSGKKYHNMGSGGAGGVYYYTIEGQNLYLIDNPTSSVTGGLLIGYSRYPMSIIDINSPVELALENENLVPAMVGYATWKMLVREVQFKNLYNEYKSEYGRLLEEAKIKAHATISKGIHYM